MLYNSDDKLTSEQSREIVAQLTTVVVMLGVAADLATAAGASDLATELVRAMHDLNVTQTEALRMGWPRG